MCFLPIIRRCCIFIQRCFFLPDVCRSVGRIRRTRGFSSVVRTPPITISTRWNKGIVGCCFLGGIVRESCSCQFRGTRHQQCMYHGCVQNQHTFAPWRSFISNISSLLCAACRLLHPCISASPVRRQRRLVYTAATSITGIVTPSISRTKMNWPVTV